MSWQRTGGDCIGEDALSDAVLQAAAEAEPLICSRPVPWSHYQNVVTSSYRHVFMLADLALCHFLDVPFETSPIQSLSFKRQLVGRCH